MQNNAQIEILKLIERNIYKKLLDENYISLGQYQQLLKLTQNA